MIDSSLVFLDNPRLPLKVTFRVLCVSPMDKSLKSANMSNCPRHPSPPLYSSVCQQKLNQTFLCQNGRETLNFCGWKMRLGLDTRQLVCEFLSIPLFYILQRPKSRSHCE